MFGSNGGLWNAVMWLHVHMLCVCECVCACSVCAVLPCSQVCLSSLVDSATHPKQVENTLILATLIVKRGVDGGVSVRRRRRIKGGCELKISSVS